MKDQIVLNGQLISYLKSGQAGTNDTVVFLHGWRSNKEVWGQVVNRLISQSVNKPVSIYALDLPGFGSSPAPESAWNVGNYSNVAAEFIQKLNLNNVILVGHSFGGRVGIKLSATRPDLIKRLVLVDAAGFVMDAKKKKALGLAAKLAKPFFKPKFMQGLRKKIYQQIGAEDYVATPELKETFVNTVNEDLTENMKRISQPTLIIWGENDKETPLSDAQKMRSLIVNSKLQILGSAGHFSFLDQPEEFVKLLKDFI